MTEFRTSAKHLRQKVGTKKEYASVASLASDVITNCSLRKNSAAAQSGGLTFVKPTRRFLHSFGKYLAGGAAMTVMPRRTIRRTSWSILPDRVKRIDFTSGAADCRRTAQGPRRM